MLSQVMMKTLETDNVQSELFQIHGKVKEKCKTFTELAKKYSRCKGEIVKMSQKSHSILDEIDKLMIEFNKEKADGNKNGERIEFLKQMDDACNKYNSCHNTIHRGGHFYIQLAAHLEQLTQNVNDYAMSRKIEKDELLANESPKG